MKKLFVLILLLVSEVNFAQNELFLAENYFREGAYAKAEQLYQELFDKNPQNTTYLKRLISCFQETTNFSAAESLLKKQLAKRPTDTYLYVELGYNFDRQLLKEEAKVNYEKALNSIDKNPGFGGYIARLFQENTLLDYAIAAYQKTMSLNPNLNYNFQIAQIYGEQGDFEKMFTAYIDLLDTNDAYLSTVQRFTSAYITEDSQSKNNNLFKKIVIKKSVSNPKNVWNQLLSWVFTQQKEYNKAFIQEKALFQRNPEFISNIINLGVLAFNAEDYENSYACFDFVKTNSPIGDYKLIAANYMLQIGLAKKQADIETQFRNYFNEFGENSSTFQGQLLYAKYLTFQKDQAEKAIIVLNKAMKHSSSRFNQAKIKLQLGEIYVYLGKFNKALIEFWNVNDGGLDFITYTSVNDVKPTTVYKSNGVVNTQLYDVAITPNSANGDYIMANQDNDGFSREMHNGTRQWIAASAGDGVTAVINYNNPLIRYLGGTGGNMTKTGTGYTGKYNGETSGKVAGAGFTWPLEIHTTDPTILYGGGSDVFKITDPNAGADFATAITNAVNLNSGAGQISKISTHGTGIATVGATASKLSVNGGTSWTTIVNPAGQTINSVDFNQSTMSIVYVTVSGYSDGNKVFKSTDSGATWTNISAGLPNIVMKEVVLKQNEGTEILFAATELGVYFKNGADNWKRFGAALPNVIVNDIDINYTEDKLVAATFGRGLWHINIANATLGVDDVALISSPFSAYPSPVLDGKLNFKVDQVNANFDYKIYNVLGGVVAEGKKDTNSGIIHVGNLPTGIYMLKAYKKGIVFPTVKFLVSNK